MGTQASALLRTLYQIYFLFNHQMKNIDMYLLLSETTPNAFRRLQVYKNVSVALENGNHNKDEEIESLKQQIRDLQWSKEREVEELKNFISERDAEIKGLERKFHEKKKLNENIGTKVLTIGRSHLHTMNF